MAVELWIPRTAEEAPAACHLCNWRGPRHRLYAHMRNCVKRYRDEIDEFFASQRDFDHGASVFTTHADPERYAYERQKAIREKRKDVKGINGNQGSVPRRDTQKESG